VKQSDVVHVGKNFKTLEARISLEFAEKRLKKSAEEEWREH
tara:strand:- start:162 stop:284 length:123 start_codon:yes stop_codon:yes gene_type:complete